MIRLRLKLKHLKRLVIIREYANLSTQTAQLPLQTVPQYAAQLKQLIRNMKENLACKKDCTCLECPDFPFETILNLPTKNFKCEPPSSCPGT